MKFIASFARCSFRLLAAVSGLGVTFARADVTMEVKVERSIPNDPGRDRSLATTTTIIDRIKGDKMRTDKGDETSYRDGATGDEVTVDHKSNEVTRLSAAEARAILEKSKEKMVHSGKSPGDPHFAPTGQQEMVGPYHAAIYTRTFQGAVTTLYLSKDFPNYAALKAELAVIGKVPGREEDAKLDGIVVKSVTKVPFGSESSTTYVATLVSIKQEPLDAALFVPPAGK